MNYQEKLGQQKLGEVKPKLGLIAADYDETLRSRVYPDFTDILAIDVSEQALQQIPKTVLKSVATLEELSRGVQRQYDVVYCFDVLYHLTEKQAWRQAINELCTTSKGYVIIHGFLPRWFAIPYVRHVRFRTARAHDAEFEQHGFKRVATIPTHALLMRMPWYLLYRFVPSLCFRLDKGVMKLFHIFGLDALASHKMIVYAKQETH